MSAVSGFNWLYLMIYMCTSNVLSVCAIKFRHCLFLAVPMTDYSWWLVLDHIVPALGVLTANFIYFSSWKSVNTVLETGEVKDLNVLFFPIQMLNTSTFIANTLITFVHMANSVSLYVYVCLCVCVCLSVCVYVYI